MKENSKIISRAFCTIHYQFCYLITILQCNQISVVLISYKLEAIQTYTVLLLVTSIMLMLLLYNVYDNTVYLLYDQPKATLVLHYFAPKPISSAIFKYYSNVYFQV